MICPYCGKIMKPGIIPGDRYAFKWIAEDEYKNILSKIKKGIKLTNYWESNNLEAYMCEDCQKIIIEMQDHP